MAAGCSARNFGCAFCDHKLARAALVAMQRPSPTVPDNEPFVFVLACSLLAPYHLPQYSFLPQCERKNVIDADCARAVAAFQGDINGWWGREGDTLLSMVLARDAPLTLAALGARGDVNPYRVDASGKAAIHSAMYSGNVGAFLTTFPDFDINVPCDAAGGWPPIVAYLREWNVMPWHDETLQAMLAAGAEFCDTMWGSARRPSFARFWELRHPTCVPHVAWSVGGRRVWLAACVSLATGAAEPVSAPGDSLVACVLADALRVCVPPDSCRYRLVSEYAGLVAAFL